MDNQIKTEKSILLARIMDKKEFESFQIKGIVTGTDFEGKRLWDEHNIRGEKGDYTFMVFRNTHDTLINLTAMIK